MAKPSIHHPSTNHRLVLFMGTEVLKPIQCFKDPNFEVYGYFLKSKFAPHVEMWPVLIEIMVPLIELDHLAQLSNKSRLFGLHVVQLLSFIFHLIVGFCAGISFKLFRVIMTNLWTIYNLIIFTLCLI